MKRHLSLSFASSLCAIACYLAFALLAFAHYPLSYSPLRNWLSDLGNPDLNPSGAIFYNVGIIATAVVLPPFLLGLSRWRMANNRTQYLMLLIMQGFGIFGAFAVAALRYHAACPRWLLIVFACSALIDILSGVFHTVTALEWVTVALLLCSVGLPGVETNRLSTSKIDRFPTMAIR